MVIVKGGISSGIEKFNKVGMPALFVMLVIVIARALSLPGSAEGLKFMFVPGYAVQAGFIEKEPRLYRNSRYRRRSDVLLPVACNGRNGHLRLLS